MDMEKIKEVESKIIEFNNAAFYRIVNELNYVIEYQNGHTAKLTEEETFEVYLLLLAKNWKDKNHSFYRFDMIKY